MKKVAIYVRVSTREQELNNQLLQLRRYCKKSGWKIFDEYCDIISGKEMSRPKYDKMFNDAHKKLFDVVLFWDISRFSRSGTLFTLQKFKELENLGIEWHSYQDKYFSSLGGFKDVVVSIMATIAKMEREKISERTKAGFYKDGNGVTRSVKHNKRVGRSAIPDEITKQVEIFLDEGILSYREISRRMIYKTKFGKEHHISPAQITKIKNRRLEKGCAK